MPQKPHRNGHRWPVPACAGLCLALAAGGLQAMNPPGSPGSCSSSSVQAPPMIPLFSLTSHLAASDAAKAFIRSRLAGWELEQASLRVLAETTCDHFCGQLTLNRIDLDQIYRKLNHRTASREETISNPEYELIADFEKAPFMAEFQACLPDLDRTLEEDVKQLRSRIAEVCGASCDAIYYGGFSEWEGDPKDGSGPLITSLLAAIQQQGFAGSAPSKLRST